MRERHKRIWIELTPVETIVSVVVVMILLGVGFGLGMHYGQGLTQEFTDPDAGTDKKAIATIEQYLKDHPSSFHFQKVLNADDPQARQYLYALDDKKAEATSGKALEKLVRKTLPENRLSEEAKVSAPIAPSLEVPTPLNEPDIVLTDPREAVTTDVSPPSPPVPSAEQVRNEAGKLIAKPIDSKNELENVPESSPTINNTSSNTVTVSPPMPESPPLLASPPPSPDILATPNLELPSGIEKGMQEKAILPPTHSGYVIQVETFDEENRAKKRQLQLVDQGFTSFIDVHTPNATLPYRLFVGPYATKDDAKSVLEKLRAVTRPDAFVRYYEGKTGNP